jgi:hypothetical protein
LSAQLDEVVNLEMDCKRLALQLEIAEEKAEGFKDGVAKVKADGEREAEADKGTTVQLLNERARATEELEKVLVSLSDDPEMKAIQQAHEQEKADITKKSIALQEELRGGESAELHERKQVDAKLDGVIHTARNLGQIAAYFLQTGATEEAAEFYVQAKAIFDSILGPEHPKTLAWQEDLFFLINAPAIQEMVKRTAKEMKPNSAAAKGGDGASSAPEWWMQNLFDMGSNQTEDGDVDDTHTNWWMQNLYDMNLRNGAEKDDATGESDYMELLFGTPREGTTTARGAPAFTPRGTLVALSQVHGRSNAAMSLGMPQQKGAEPAIPEENSVNMDFTKDWVEKVFLTPRATGGDEAEQNMVAAVEWLQENFGAADGVPVMSAASKTGVAPFTPRGSQAAGLLNITQKTDDAVFHAAMQATLATPRGTADVRSSVDDTPMMGAVHKMFKGRLQHV